jgi:NADH dehydrogenase
MKVLLNSIGVTKLDRSLIAALLARQHDVRVVSAPADLAREWSEGVEVWAGDILDDPQAAHALGGVAAIIDLGGLAPVLAARSMNPALTHRLVAAATSSDDVARFVYVTSRWTAASSASDDAAIRAAEAEVERLTGRALLIRADEIYGVGDDRISHFLQMMRTLPAIPIMASGAPALQPIWHEDLATAVAASVDADAVVTQSALEISGPDAVRPDQLYDRLATLIDRRPLRLPIPEFAAQYASGMFDWPTSAAAYEELQGGAGAEGVSPILGLTVTGLDEGLGLLIDGSEEQVPSQGVGTLEVKHFWADIRASRYTAEQLLEQFRLQFGDLMPVEFGVEPASPQTSLTPGATLTTKLPGRGHVQVRVEELTDRHVTLATLRGHPLAGIVRFSTTPIADGVRFEVTTCDASSNRLDWIALTLGGARIQDGNWLLLVQHVIEMSGGTAAQVESKKQDVQGDAVDRLEDWIRDLIQARRAAEHAAAEPSPQRTLSQELSLPAPATSGTPGIGALPTPEVARRSVS